MTETVAPVQDGPARAHPQPVRALQLAQEGRYAEASAEIDAAARLAPLDAALHVARSTIYRQAGHGREALRAAEEAVRLAPSDARAHRALAMALERTGRKRDGREEARRAAQLAPDDPAVLRCLGDLLLDADPAEAERNYRRTLWRDSRSVAARLGLARALRRLGRREEAEDMLRRAEAADATVADLRRRASALSSAIVQAAVGTFLAILVLGRIPAFVDAHRPAWSDVAGVLVPAAALLAPVALLGWTALRVWRISRDAPDAVERREDLRELMEQYAR
ncbi:MAG TPA: tetratricopeptide repeat protein [Anaeromyxobacteraceae bacterium]|nr:tetratricopeptide repeat protein [Anaeromyxobacteraceae bacterium]